jgi:hypothetical protein
MACPYIACNVEGAGQRKTCRLKRFISILEKAHLTVGGRHRSSHHMSVAEKQKTTNCMRNEGPIRPWEDPLFTPSGI